MFTSDQLTIERDGHVVTLTMNRPEKRNAFGLEMLIAMADAFQMCDDDTDVRAIILTGAGGHFCAGSDLKENQLGQKDERTLMLQERFKTEPRIHWKALLREYRPAAPVIAAVEGFAVAGGTEILQGTDLRVAGKSATFGVTEAALGLFPLGGSTIRLRRQIGTVFQDFRLLPNKTVAENVAFALQVIGKPKSHIDETVPETLELVGLEGKESRMPDELSGGEQQRVAIARAFVNRPMILIADEPTGNLDPTTSVGIMKLLDRINRTGTTVLMATHDHGVVDQMRKRVIELEHGRVVRDQAQGVYGFQN